MLLKQWLQLLNKGYVYFVHLFGGAAILLLTASDHGNTLFFGCKSSTNLTRHLSIAVVLAQLNSHVTFSCKCLQDIPSCINLVSEKSDRPIDTNVLAVKFSLLSEPGHLHTGDAIVCCNEKCAAVLNHLSKLSEEVGKKEKVGAMLNMGSMI